MYKAIIMKWLPWSWKSTWAEQQEWFIIISRDILRLENPDMKEYEIVELQNSMISEYKCDIIIDDTNMNPKTLERIKKLCTDCGYEVEVKDMYWYYESDNHYLWMCIERNKNREKYVPESVIHKMYLQNCNMISNYDYNLIGEYIIVDIDWTLADLTHRLHYVKEWKKDWDSFFDNMVHDKPYTHLIDIVNILKKTGYTVVLMSWRSDKWCKETVTWLQEHGVKYDHLLMRSSWDKRDDVDVKKDLAELLIQNTWKLPSIAFDDRHRILELWRWMGIYTINCSQESDNNF